MTRQKVHCPLCSSLSSFYAAHPTVDQALYYCAACKYWFASPHESFIHAVTDANKYNKEDFWGTENANKAYSNWRNVENQKLGNLVLSELPDAGSSKLLEIGFGEGPLTDIFYPVVGEYWGIEPSPGHFEATVNRLNLDRNKVFCLQAEELSTNNHFSDRKNYFDVIVMVSVLEHLSNPLHIIRTCHDLLKPGGRLFISVPDSTNFRFFYFARRLFRLEPWTYFHISFFNESSLDELFLGEGFNINQKKRNPLITDKSISYFRWLYNSRAVSLTMNLIKTIRLDRALRMETIFYHVSKY